MAKGGAAMIEIICNGDDEAKEKNEKNIKNVLTKVFRCGIIIKRTEMCGCGGTGRRARFRF